MNLSDLAVEADVSYRTIKYAASDHPRTYTPAVCAAIAGALKVEPDAFSTAVGPHRPVKVPA
jgi:hypothetical protein